MPTSKQDSTVRGHLRYFLRDARRRAKKKNLPFDIDLDYLESLVVDKCPVFNTNFSFGLDGSGLKPTSPSLDRFVPELGYVKGNLSFISHRANSIKHNASVDDLEKLINWMRSKKT